MPHFVRDDVDGPGIGRKLVVALVNIAVCIGVGPVAEYIEVSNTPAGRRAPGNEVGNITIERSARSPK
jgi:hypothetical protein